MRTDGMLICWNCKGNMEADPDWHCRGWLKCSVCGATYCPDPTKTGAAPRVGQSSFFDKRLSPLPKIPKKKGGKK